MSQNYYKLYIDSVFDLASTIVIKSEYSAETINDLIKLQHGVEAVDPYDKSTWKYYLNICGQYHPLDEVITITSLDDLVEITFDHQTLKNHPATMEAYQYGTRYYRELVTKHPDKEAIIIGSLYPSEMTKATEAVDGAVLSYPKYLVEENELSLIKNIEQWVIEFKVRWDNKQFNVTDSLYAAGNLGIMYLNLVPLIINLRLKACKTNEVHSYHVREYLASHGMLDVFLDELSLKQALFLYRNIRYIERNNGKKDTFYWLIEKILTDRNLPLSEFTMKHDVSDIAKNIYADVGFRRKSINSVYSSIAEANPVITLDALLSKEEPLAIGNEDFTDYNQKKILDKFVNSQSSVVATKVLESSLVDYTDSEPYTLLDIQLNHWLFLSSIGVYSAQVTFKEPRSGSEYSLSAFEAYVYWFYLYCRSIDTKLDKIPNLLANRVVRPSPNGLIRIPPTALMQVADTDYVDISIAQQLSDAQPIFNTMSSVQSFTLKCQEVFEVNKFQQALISGFQHSYTRGLVDNMVTQLYYDPTIKTNDILTGVSNSFEQSYDSWLNTKNLPVFDYSPEEYQTLYSQIFKNATGGTLYTTENLSRLQKSMIKLMQQLSSYSIQFLSEINRTNVKNLNWAAIRVGDIKKNEFSKKEVLISNLRIDTLESTELKTIPVGTDNVKIEMNTGTSTSTTSVITIDVKPFISEGGHTQTAHQFNLGSLTINHVFGSDPNFVGGIKVLPAYESFQALALEEQLTIKDVYFNVFEIDPHAGKVNLRNLILRDIIPDFMYFKLSKKAMKAFKYFYVPYQAPNAIRSLLTVQLKAFYSNLGTVELPGYKLFGREQIANMFRFFAETTVLNGFIDTSGVTIGDVNTIPESLEYGISLELFKYVGGSKSLSAFDYNSGGASVNFNYTGNKYAMEFAKPFFGTSVALHPSAPGQILNAFKLVSSSSVIGGFNYGNYTLTGFTINGSEVDFN